MKTFVICMQYTTSSQNVNPSNSFLYKFCTHFKKREYKGNSHLAKRLILRLPKTKPEKEMNTYKFSERDVQAPIEINRT